MSRDSYKGRFARHFRTLDNIRDDVEDFLEWHESSPKAMNHLKVVSKALNSVILQLERFEEADEEFVNGTNIRRDLSSRKARGRW